MVASAEKRQLQFLFQILNHAAQAGMRDVRRLGRFVKATVFSDFYKITQCLIFNNTPWDPKWGKGKNSAQPPLGGWAEFLREGYSV
jgi:hypothetical protein